MAFGGAVRKLYDAVDGLVNMAGRRRILSVQVVTPAYSVGQICLRWHDRLGKTLGHGRSARLYGKPGVIGLASLARRMGSLPSSATVAAFRAEALARGKEEGAPGKQRFADQLRLFSRF
jgi:hypothetical protein